jgi:hypothetical protein
MRKLIAVVTMAMMLAMSAMPALAAPQGGPVVTGGLVNVTIVDAIDVNRNTVQLPIAVAANVCYVDINVLAADLADDGKANCTATADSRANNR